MTAPRETDPLAIADALMLAMNSPAIADVYQRRLEQISKHGRTQAIDGRQSISSMARKIADYCGSAVDHCGHGHSIPAERLTYARRHIVTSAALAIATIERIDSELAALRAEEGEAA